jgi:peptide/nickel transport system permease protein
VYSRTIWGARSVLLTAPAAAILAVIMGTMLGLITGFYRGLVDDVISRIIEGFLSIPVILLALLAATTLGTSRVVIITVIAVLFTPVVTRTIRSSVIAEAQLDYVTSARLRGESSFFIMTREIYPNVTGTVVVELTVRLGYAIFTVATLAFLGIASGDVTTPDWGVDINQTFVLIQSNQWWPTIFPALAIAALVIAVNLVADTIDRVNKA